jgi:uncharacterized membrane protein
MDSTEKYSLCAILINIILALAIAASGVYALVERKLIISGKYTGSLHYFNQTESILVAVSHFLVSIFILLFLSKNKTLKNIAQWLLLTAIALFIVSPFLGN